MYEDIIKPGRALFIITAVVSLLLAVANGMTAPVIAQNEIIAKKEAMSKVLPGVTDNNFSDDVLVEYEKGIVSYNIGYAGDEIYGYAVLVSVKGYGGEINMLVGMKADRTVEGVSIISHNETPGLGANATNKKFTNQYIGKRGILGVTKSGSPKDSEIEAMTSATITSKAVTYGVNLATEYITKLSNWGETE